MCSAAQVNHRRQKRQQRMRSAGEREARADHLALCAVLAELGDPGADPVLRLHRDRRSLRSVRDLVRVAVRDDDEVARLELDPRPAVHPDPRLARAQRVKLDAGRLRQLDSPRRAVRAERAVERRGDVELLQSGLEDLHRDGVLRIGLRPPTGPRGTGSEQCRMDRRISRPSGRSVASIACIPSLQQGIFAGFAPRRSGPGEAQILFRDGPEHLELQGSGQRVGGPGAARLGSRVEDPATQHGVVVAGASRRSARSTAWSRRRAARGARATCRDSTASGSRRSRACAGCGARGPRRDHARASARPAPRPRAAYRRVPRRR